MKNAIYAFYEKLKSGRDDFEDGFRLYY